MTTTTPTAKELFESLSRGDRIIYQAPDGFAAHGFRDDSVIHPVYELTVNRVRNLKSGRRVDVINQFGTGFTILEAAALRAKQFQPLTEEEESIMSETTATTTLPTLTDKQQAAVAILAGAGENGMTATAFAEAAGITNVGAATSTLRALVKRGVVETDNDAYRVMETARPARKRRAAAPTQKRVKAVRKAKAPLVAGEILRPHDDLATALAEAGWTVPEIEPGVRVEGPQGAIEHQPAGKRGMWIAYRGQKPVLSGDEPRRFKHATAALTAVLAEAA